MNVRIFTIWSYQVELFSSPVSKISLSGEDFLIRTTWPRQDIRNNAFFFFFGFLLSLQISFFVVIPANENEHLQEHTYANYIQKAIILFQILLWKMCTFVK